MKKYLEIKQFLLLIMRITLPNIAFILLFTGISQAHDINAQDLLDKKVSLNVEQESIKSILNKIENLTEVQFVYSPKVIRAGQKISINVHERKLSQVLQDLFENQNISYEIVGGQIILKKKDKSTSLFEVPDQPITGTVTGKRDKQPIPGVNILVQGTNTGTITDANGKFTINAPENATLVFSFIGYTPQIVKIGGQSELIIELEEDIKSLDEVVVTALGIKKESRALGYSTTTVPTEQITTVRTPNVGNSLEGKVAGLNITPPTGGPGSSSKIRIRGQASLGGDNNPLIVINGVPVTNDVYNNQGGNSRDNQGSDQGDGLNSINPDDIESITVLKGLSAAALYGSGAKNGVIMINTKSGNKNQGIGVTLSSNIVQDRALDYTDFQYEYGQGENGVKPVADPGSVNYTAKTGQWSFGGKIDGSMVPIFNGQMRPYTAQKHRIRDFFRPALTSNTTLGLSGGNEKGSFNLSFGNLSGQSIVPNSNFTRYTGNLGVNYQLSKKVNASANIIYSNEYNNNPPITWGQNFGAIPNSLYNLSNTIPLSDLENSRKDTSGNEVMFSRFATRNNPYWSALERFERIKKDRIIANIALKYNIFDWLYLQGRIAEDYTIRNTELNQPTGSQGIAGTVAPNYNGSYYQGITQSRFLNLDALLNANKKFGEFGFDFTLGASQYKSQYLVNDINVTNFSVPNLYVITNGIVKDPQFQNYRSIQNSVYGALEVSYKNLLFLNGTGRSEWYSQIDPSINQKFFPSLSASLVVSELFNQSPSWLDYLKIRASYAGSAGPPGTYTNKLYKAISSNPYSSTQPNGFISGGTVPNYLISAYNTNEKEIGFEVRMFNNRLTIDAAFYHKITKDQPLYQQVSDASGYVNKLVNIAQSGNKGVELLITGIPVKTEKFQWEASFNVSYNISKLDKLNGNSQSIIVGTGPFTGQVAQIVGEPLQQLQSYGYRYTPDGQIINDPGGTPYSSKATTGFKTYGSAIPKWVGGLTNNFTYKDFRFSFLIDFKFGNKILSNTNFNLYREGLSKETLYGRGSADNKMVGPGVKEVFDATGKIVTGYVKNDIPVDVEAYYATVRNHDNIGEPFVYNGGFIQLRQMSLGYNFGKLLKNKALKGASFSIVSNNVFLIKKWIPNLHPEQVSSGSDNLIGIESSSLPLTRSVGVNFNLKF